MNWRRVEGFDMYEVSDQGIVRNRYSGLTLRPRLDSDGYELHTLTRGRAPAIQVTVKTHRLVAVAFCDRPTPKHNQVDHINGTRTDNAATNLRWATSTLNNLNRRGTRGVRRHHSGMWQAYTSIKGQWKHLGMFVAEADALAARQDYMQRRIAECTLG